MIEYYSSYKTNSSFLFFFSAWPVTKVIQYKSSNESWASSLLTAFFYWQIVFICFFFFFTKVEQINKPPRSSNINIPNHPYFQLDLQKRARTTLIYTIWESTPTFLWFSWHSINLPIEWCTVQEELQTIQIFSVWNSVRFYFYKCFWLFWMTIIV